MSMRRLIYIATAILLLGGCYAFYSGGGSAQPDANGDGIKDTLVIGAAAEINNLDLLEQNDQINNICLKLTHETLLFFANDGKVKPELAESWRYLDDRTLELKLRRGVTFSDGTPMTADDVKFTYEKALSGHSAGVLAGITSVDAPDPYTVLLHLGDDDAAFLLNLTSIPCSIQSKKAWESGMDKPWLIGTGQYVFEKWDKGKEVSFVRNDKYWDQKNKGVADRIIFVPIPDANKRVRALKKHKIDVCLDPPIDSLEEIADDKEFTVFEEAGTRLFYFAFNVSKEPWNNLTLRQAVACAIDRSTVIDKAVSGKGVPQTTVLNRGLWGFYDGIPGFGYNVERAKKLLAETPYPEGGIKASLLIADNTQYRAIADVIRDNLQKIGIQVKINVCSEAELKDRCAKGEQELYIWRWNEDQKIDWVYGDLYRSNSPYNYHHYKNERADKLIEKVRTEKDEPIRYSYGIELQTLLVHDCPQVPLYVANLVIAYNSGLRDEYLFGGGNHDWSHAYIEINK